MKNLKKFALALCAVLSLTAFVSCDDEKTEDYYSIRLGEESEAYSNNLLLQICVTTDLLSFTATSEDNHTLRSEKEAKAWFDEACESVKESYQGGGDLIVIAEDTWVFLELVNSKNAIVKSKKVTFD